MPVIIWMISGIAAALNGDKDDKHRRRQSSSEAGEISISYDADTGGFGGGDSGGGGDGGGW